MEAIEINTAQVANPCAFRQIRGRVPGPFNKTIADQVGVDRRRARYHAPALGKNRLRSAQWRRISRADNSFTAERVGQGHWRRRCRRVPVGSDEFRQRKRACAGAKSILFERPSLLLLGTGNSVRAGRVAAIDAWPNRLVVFFVFGISSANLGCRCGGHGGRIHQTNVDTSRDGVSHWLLSAVAPVFLFWHAHLLGNCGARAVGDDVPRSQQSIATAEFWESTLFFGRGLVH